MISSYCIIAHNVKKISSRARSPGTPVHAQVQVFKEREKIQLKKVLKALSEHFTQIYLVCLSKYCPENTLKFKNKL